MLKIIYMTAHCPKWCTRMFTEKSSGVKRGVYTLLVRIWNSKSNLQAQ